ncbi:MAG: thioredoxin family protein [Culicoidibacterales bacterium]
MQIWTQAEAQSVENVDFLYFYTPLCGTCHLATQMLEIVEATQKFDGYAINLNHFPEFAQVFQVEQVPCLISLKTQAKLYTFANVVNLYNFCQTQLKTK